MTLVTGTVQDLGYDGMEGILWARPARFRSDGQVVYAPERKPYKITGGVVSADLAPGPAVLEVQVGSHARGTFEVVIPEEDVTLADLLETVFVWEPEQVSLFVAVREAAEQAASDAAAAAQQTWQDRSHVDQVAALLDDAYDQSQAGMTLPPRLTETALNDTYARGSVLPPSQMIDVQILPLVQDVFVIDRLDGQTWGYSSGRLYTTPDHGHSWVDQCAAPEASVIRGLRNTPDGEVVAFTSQKLFKSSGWGMPGLAWTQKLTTHGTAQFNTFSIDGSSDGQKLILAEYGPGGTQAWIDSRYAHISVDGGDTWHTRWDSDAITGNTPEGSHVHAAGYDEITDRFYVSEGHSVGAGIWHSTDDGLTWARAEGMRCDDPAVNLGMDAGPTMIITTDDGLSVGADDVLGGMYGVPRTADPMDAQLRHLWAWRPNRSGTNGFHRNGMLDPETGLAYMCTSSSGPAPIISAGNAHTAGLVWEWPNWAGTSTDNINAVIVEPGGWIVAYGTENGVQKSILGRVPDPAVALPVDKGGLWGGVAQDPTSVAAGVGARAIESQRAVVVGSSSSALNEDVIVGSLIDGVTGSAGGKVIIGARASASYASVVIGRYAAALGSQSVVVGNGATSSGNAGQTALGHNAVAAGTSATVFGANAQGTAVGTVAFGRNTVASGLRSTAIGIGAQSLHADSMALGNSTVTTGTTQVHVGTRYMAMMPTTGPTTSAINGGAGALWVEGGRFWTRTDTQESAQVATIHSGTTAARPAATVVGFQYFDTTLGQPIVWNGTEWVDMAGVAV